MLILAARRRPVHADLVEKPKLDVIRPPLSVSCVATIDDPGMRGWQQAAAAERVETWEHCATWSSHHNFSPLNFL